MQRIAVPSYFYPSGKGDVNWSCVIEASPTVGIAIINPNSGPGHSSDPNYINQVNELKKRSIKVLGYVHTSYATRPLDDVKEEIQRFQSWYSVDGIFLDEVPTQTCYLPYYIHLHTLLVASSLIVVINPGTQTSEEYAKVADVICDFEDSGRNYLGGGYKEGGWMSKYPSSMFWHIVHSVGSTTELKEIMQKRKKRNAGWVFVTSEVMPNPYGKMPYQSFWEEEVQLCKAEQCSRKSKWKWWR